ncbi:metallophosphoesterase family protein [Miniphocaeibacter halophilus]|uniref:Metallophosphoesterase family protein n=1 Tax=Miniphocaeibacter halophilus TaxID=2931922 RepID=A0AC61MSP9_9FIRM|nr:metallophosphoesterase [Miniphocaeibacter halophilus]QQK07620.1 metallophosphoesterase family protein [Miniphocaeibacter halophilus]
MKFLFFTDTHIRSTNPVSRKDNFLETIENKFAEINSLINKYDIDYVLHGGDLFDRPDIPVRIIGKFANILKSFNKPIYIISGNHDIYGHNPNTVDRSMLGLLNTLDIVTLINKDDPIILKEENLRIQLSGCPYIYDIDSEYKKYYFPQRLEDVDYHIFLIHSFLIDKPFVDSVSHTLIEEILEIDADIVLSGHYHTGFGVKNINNKYFINPGSLLRTNSSKPELKRIPEVVIMDISKEGINIKEIPLKSALPGEDVLKINNNYEKLKSEALEDFKLLVRQSSNLESYNIYDILKEISEKNNFPKRILEEALKRIEDIEVNKK